MKPNQTKVEKIGLKANVIGTLTQESSDPMYFKVTIKPSGFVAIAKNAELHTQGGMIQILMTKELANKLYAIQEELGELFSLLLISSAKDDQVLEVPVKS